MNVATLIAVAVNANGHREIVGLDVVTGEDGSSWTSFLRGLVARGLKGVRLVISDSHEASSRRSRRCWWEPAGSAAGSTSSAT